MRAPKSITLVTLLMAGLVAFSQTDPEKNPTRKKADQNFELLAFAKAIKQYERLVSNEDQEAHATIRLADCYRLINDPMNAETWYRRAVTYKESKPVHILYFAQALMQNEKYTEAYSQFSRYSDINPDDTRGWRGVEACERIEEFNSTKEDYSIVNLPFNIEWADFGPAYYENGVVFASEREIERQKEAIFEWTGRPFLNMWYAEEEGDDAWSEPVLLTGSAQTKYHDGPAQFSGDQQQMFFTRNFTTDNNKVTKSENDIVELKLMTAWKSERSNRWGSPKDIGFNDKEFSNGHPSVSYDGTTLYFSSDRKGGHGGTDIWMSKFDGEWGTPVNLGPTINTEGNEMFPYIAKDSTLYFASNAHPGLGGLDIFHTKMDDNGSFKDVHNIGAPINSSRDDFAIILKDNLQTGYFSSNRSGGKGDDDIYKFNSLTTKLEIYVYDCNSGLPIETSTVNVKLGDQVIITDETDEDGMVYATVHRNRDFTCGASKEGYEAETTDFTTKGVLAGETVRVEICLGGKCIVHGIVRDKNIMEPIEGAEVTLTNNESGEQWVMTTGTDGKYTFDADPGNYTVTARKEEYAYDEGEVRLSARAGEPCIANLDLYLEYVSGLALDNIYYDFDKSNIREDASSDLQKVLRILQDNPDMRVELGSHTDARGTDQYNEGLSQRRAQSVVNWLIRNGIAADRLVAKGYGETTLRNHCGNGIPCTEYEHQRNRRTELAVIDKDGNRIPGREHYNDPDEKFEYIEGGYYGDAPRVEGTLLPGGVVPPGQVPDPPDPDKDDEEEDPHQP